MTPADQTAAAGPARTARLRPLLALQPYLLRYPHMLGLAIAALVASAAAMLVVPVAVRRMVDHGFSGGDGAFMDQYFAMLIVIGLALALACATRCSAT